MVQQKVSEPVARLQLYYVSRTHTQLSQFVREVAKTKFNETVRI